MSCQSECFGIKKSFGTTNKLIVYLQQYEDLVFKLEGGALLILLPIYMEQVVSIVP